MEDHTAKFVQLADGSDHAQHMIDNMLNLDAEHMHLLAEYLESIKPAPRQVFA